MPLEVGTEQLEALDVGELKRAFEQRRDACATGARSHSKLMRPGNDSVRQGLTFDMSGGPKGAKRPLGRPLDGGVGRSRYAE